MRLKPTLRARAAQGFSLIELMIAIVVALILLGSLVAFIASSIQSNAQTIAATRLSQELRALTDVVTHELRRARFQNNAVNIIAAGSPAPAALKAFQTITVVDQVTATADTDSNTATTDGDCIKYAYEGAAGGNFRTLYYSVTNGVGAIYIARGAGPASPACTDNTAIRLSSPQVNVTLLTFNFDSTANSVLVTVQGQLAADSSFSRRFTELVRLPSASIN